MKYGFVAASCAVLIIFVHHAYADSAVLPTPQDYDLSQVPPTTLDLFKKDLEKRDTETLDAFKHVVQDSLHRHHKTKRTVKDGVHPKSIKTALASMLIQQNAASQGMIDIVQKQLESPELQEKKISLHLKAMPVKEAFALISKSSGVQLVVDADITGSIQELRLDDVPLAAVLNSILGSNEPRLALLKDFGVWRVMKMQTARELFTSIAARERERDFSTLTKSLLYVKWNDALKTRIEKLWQGITQASSDKQNMYLVLDDVNRKIFCKAHKDQIEEFSRVLGEMDIKVPQIKIDARVVRTTKDFEDVLGINWSGVYNRRESVKHVNFVGLGPFENEKGNGNPTDKSTPYDEITGWALNLVPSAIKSTLSSVPFIFGNNDMNTKRLNMTLNAAEYRNDVKTILKPSLLVCNEESAEILIGETMPHAVRLDEVVESKPTNVTTVNYKDIGIMLKVKPTVAPDHGSVLLEIFVENSYVADLKVKREQGSRESEFNYTVRTSRSVNRVLLRSGQTTLIGGLIIESKAKDSNDIPFLKDIPVIGWLFKASRHQACDEQLLIFITPTLVDV
jgi:type IV pilus assembly protein PilQ